MARFLGEANLIEGAVDGGAGEFASIRTAGGLPLRARSASQAASGAKASLFFRPERVAISADPGAGAGAADGDANRARGRIVQASFLGNILRYAVEIEPGQQVTVDVQNARGITPLAVGANVSLAWHATDSALLLA